MKTLTNTRKLIALGIFLTILCISCEKTEDGEDGVAGKNGSANIASRTFSVSSWAYSSPNHYADLPVPELTAENINSAGVMVYYSIVEGTWRAVPYTEYRSSANYFMNSLNSVGNVKVTWTYNNSLSSGDDPNTYYNTTVKCKVVIIPPAAKILKPNVDYKNYLEVKEAFDLED